MKCARIFLPLICFLAPMVPISQAKADGGVPLWTNLYGGLGNGDNFSHAIAIDANGKIFVTGATSAGPTIRNLAATVAYSTAGAPLWTNLSGGPNTLDAAAVAIAVDSQGNVFVTGYSDPSSTNGYFATASFSNRGGFRWARRYQGPNIGINSATAIALDTNGNVFVTGLSAGDFLGSDYATVAYSNLGVPLWTNRYRGTYSTNSDNYAYAIAVDSGGNVFVTGESDGAYGTVACSGNGTPLWTNRYSGPVSGYTIARAIALDKSGNVFVTGFTADAEWNYEYATVAYTGAGVPLWTNTYHGPGYKDLASAIAVDGNGNVFVMGYSAHDYTPNYDYAIVAYSGAGVALWTNRYPGGNTVWDAGTGVAIDQAGNVFGTGTLPHIGQAYLDYATVAYSALGVPLWTNRFYRTSVRYPDNLAGRIAVDSNNCVVVTGASRGTNFIYEYATIKYSSSALSAAIQVSPLASFPGVSNLIVIAANNTNACVTLTGSSADADQDFVTYQWFNNTDSRPFASGELVTDCLGVGPHTLRLYVSDGHSSAGRASVDVQVVSPCTAIDFAVAQLENSALPDNRRHPLLVSLQGACSSFDGGEITAGISQLSAFQNKVQAQLTSSAPDLAQQLIDTVQVIIDAMQAQ